METAFFLLFIITIGRFSPKGAYFFVKNDLPDQGETIQIMR